MIRNYLKVAWRNILNNKVYSALNIVGLGAVISCGAADCPFAFRVIRG
jgi:hypothetical protein